MELIQLRCFLAVADELHFRAAPRRRLDMLPGVARAAPQEPRGRPGHHARHPRPRAACRAGRYAGRICFRRRAASSSSPTGSRSGRGTRIARWPRRCASAPSDSAAIGLGAASSSPISGNRTPESTLSLHEQKSIRLLPRLLSGKPRSRDRSAPGTRRRRLRLQALSSRRRRSSPCRRGHPLAARESLTPAELADQPLIVPDRQSRPHSHDLTIKLLLDAGLTARVAQIAEEKHYDRQHGRRRARARDRAALVVASGRPWGAVSSPSCRPTGSRCGGLQLAAAWVRNTRVSGPRQFFCAASTPTWTKSPPPHDRPAIQIMYIIYVALSAGPSLP